MNTFADGAGAFMQVYSLLRAQKQALYLLTDIQRPQRKTVRLRNALCTEIDYLVKVSSTRARIENQQETGRGYNDLPGAVTDIRY